MAVFPRRETRNGYLGLSSADLGHCGPTTDCLGRDDYINSQTVVAEYSNEYSGIDGGTVSPPQPGFPRLHQGARINRLSGQPDACWPDRSLSLPWAEFNSVPRSHHLVQYASNTGSTGPDHHQRHRAVDGAPLLVEHASGGERSSCAGASRISPTSVVETNPYLSSRCEIVENRAARRSKAPTHTGLAALSYAGAGLTKGTWVATQIAIGPIHHLRLTVTHVAVETSTPGYWGLTRPPSCQRRVIRPPKRCAQSCGAASSWRAAIS